MIYDKIIHFWPVLERISNILTQNFQIHMYVSRWCNISPTETLHTKPMRTCYNSWSCNRVDRSQRGSFSGKKKAWMASEPCRDDREGDQSYPTPYPRVVCPTPTGGRLQTRLVSGSPQHWFGRYQAAGGPRTANWVAS